MRKSRFTEEQIVSIVREFILANQTAGDATLEGFTITGAGTNSAAISASDSDPLTIKSCRVIENELGVAGTAVQGNSTELVILDSEVSFNTADQIAGIVMREAGIELRRTRIEGNQGTGLVVGADVPVVVTDCEFIGNRGGRWGGGAYIGTQIPVVVERNLFLRNHGHISISIGRWHPVRICERISAVQHIRI